MMHLLAYAISSAGGVTNQDTPGMVDNFASLQNNHYILQAPWYIKFAYGLGANLTNARINTPALRSVNLPSIGVIDAAANPTSLPGIEWLYGQLLRINPIDETAMELTDSAGAGELFGLLGLMDTPAYTIPTGSIFTVRATAAITVGNKVWGAGVFVIDQALPAGRYSVVGMDVVGANLVAARLNFQGGGPRPGVIARTSVANKPDPMFRGGQLGEWGQFESTAQPYIELLGTAAPTTQTIYLDLIKVR